MANGMVLQIVAGDTPIHGGNTWTIAAGKGHEISPASTYSVQKKIIMHIQSLNIHYIRSTVLDLRMFILTTVQQVVLLRLHHLKVPVKNGMIKSKVVFV